VYTDILSTKTNVSVKNKSKFSGIIRDMHMNRYIYIMLLPVVIYYLIFNYAPIFGLQIAFKDYRPTMGIWASRWIGLRQFKEFFASYYCWRLIRNTLLINFYDIIFGFPAPIIFALLINEIRGNLFKRTVQTVTYMPHFVSTVVICGMIVDFFSLNGWINNLVTFFTGHAPVQFLQSPECFRALYVGSGIWQELGWGSIIYLAALTSIDFELYEASKMDGAGRWYQLVHITIPGIVPTIIIMLILRVGRMMNIGAEKVLLLYNPSTYETADVINTFVYRKGLLEANYGYSTAVGLFNALINFALVIAMNQISKKVTENSLW